MRIMHVESGRHLYGGARQVAYLIEGLAAHGINSVLVCARGAEIAKAVRGAGIAGAVRGAEVVEVSMRGDLDVIFAARLAQLINLYGPSLVHVHSRRGADTFGGWCARSAGVPAVLTRRVDNREPAWWARFKYWPYARLAAISSAVESELVGHAGLKASRVVRVASAVDSGRFRPHAAPAARKLLSTALDLPPEAVLIGFVAQLIPRKGHALLLDCLPEVVSRYPDTCVLCFGRGPLKQALQREIAERGLGKNVRLTGFRSDLADLLPGLDMMVHPALREGLGVAVLEAMSAGVPVVASDAGGIPDVIENGQHGLLFESGNGEALRDAMLPMLADEALRARLSEAGRERVKARFSIERMSRRYLEVYNQVVSNRA